MILLCIGKDSIYSSTSTGSDIMMTSNCIYDISFSSPGRSPGRAIEPPLALTSASALASVLAAVSGLAKSLTLKFFM